MIQLLLHFAVALRHKEACDQLEKGRELFTRVLAPLAKLGEDWTHVGLVCCPEVESRQHLVQAGLSVEQAQVDRMSKLLSRHSNPIQL